MLPCKSAHLELPYHYVFVAPCSSTLPEFDECLGCGNLSFPMHGSYEVPCLTICDPAIFEHIVVLAVSHVDKMWSRYVFDRVWQICSLEEVK